MLIALPTQKSFEKHQSLFSSGTANKFACPAIARERERESPRIVYCPDQITGKIFLTADGVAQVTHTSSHAGGLSPVGQQVTGLSEFLNSSSSPPWLCHNLSSSQQSWCIFHLGGQSVFLKPTNRHGSECMLKMPLRCLFQPLILDSAGEEGRL